jgi:hypothetical protein
MNFGCAVSVFEKAGYCVPVPFGIAPTGRENGSDER